MVKVLNMLGDLVGKRRLIRFECGHCGHAPHCTATGHILEGKRHAHHVRGDHPICRSQDDDTPRSGIG